MTKTKLLLAGLLTGAVAFGTACKTDKSTTNTNTGTDTSMTTDAGTGGAGLDNPDRGTNPLPNEGMREMEPGVHDDTHDTQPGTGGTGLEPEPLDRGDRLGGETSDEPLNPGAPANQPTPGTGTMNNDDGTNPIH